MNDIKWLKSVSLFIVAMLAGLRLMADIPIGAWNSDFTDSLSYAQANDLPIVVIWGNTSCSHCVRLNAVLEDERIMEWAHEHSAVLVLKCEGLQSVSTDHVAAKEWCTELNPNLREYPFVGVCWTTNNVAACRTAFVGRSGRMPTSDDTLAGQFATLLEDALDTRVGSRNTPKTLTVGNGIRTFETPCEPAPYYCKLWLEAERSYYFASSNLTVVANDACEVTGCYNIYYRLVGDEIGYEVRPATSGYVTLCISGTGACLRYGPSVPYVWTYDMYAAAGEGRITSPSGAWSLPCDRTGARLDLYWSADATGSGALEVPTLAQEFVTLGGGAVRTNLWNVGFSEKGFRSCSPLTSLSFDSEFACQQLPSFSNCSNLVSVSIPKGVANIGTSSFDGCVGLRSVSVAAGGAVGSVLNLPLPEADVEDDDVITHCMGWDDWGRGMASLQSFQIGEDGLDVRMATLKFSHETVAGGDAAYLFSYEGLADRVVVPSTAGGISVVGIDSLNCNDRVREIEVSEGVEEIATAAFDACVSLERVGIPSSVWYLGDGWCSGCDNLMQIDFAADGELSGQWVDLPAPGCANTRLWGWNDKSDGSGHWWGENGLQTIPADGASLYAVRTPNDFDFIQTDDGIIVSQYGTQDGSGETFVVDRMAGQKVVGLAANALSGLSGYASIRIAGTVRSIEDCAFEGQLNETLTNVIFEAGALAGKNVNLPIPLAAPEGMVFFGWRLTGPDGECVWSREAYNPGLGGEQPSVRVPDEGGTFVAVFVRDEIGWEETDGGIVLNCHPLAEEAVSFAVPGDVAGRPVVGIGSDLLSGRSTLASVSIPNSVRSVAEGAFADTGIWNESPEGLVVADGWVVGRKYEEECLVDTVMIGSEIRGVADGVFNGWSSLREISFAGALKNASVSLPYTDQVHSTFLGWCTTRDGMGDWVLYDENIDACRTTVTNAVTFYAVFHDDGLSLESVAGSDSMRIVGIGYAPRNFTVPTEYDGAAISEIGDDAIYGQCDLMDLVVPSGIVRVGDGAFSSCDQLGSVRMAGTVQSFGKRVFSCCNGLSNVVFEAGAVAGQTLQLPLLADREDERFFGWRRKDADAAAAWSRVAYDDELGTDVCHVTVPEEGATFEAVFVPDWIAWEERDDGIVLTGYGLSDETLGFTVPSEIFGRPVTGIADPLFSSCTELKSVSLPDGLTFVGMGVFDATPLVTNVVNGFVVMDGWICGRQDEFFGRASRVTLPAGVVGIAERALADWSSLRRLELNPELRVIGSGAFSGSGLVTLSVPANVRVVAGDAFSDCYSLRTLAFSGSELVGARLHLPDPSAQGMTLLGWRASGADWEVWSELECDEANGVWHDVIEVPDVESCVFSAVFCTGNYAWEVDWETEGVNLVGSDSLPAQVTLPERICGGTVVTLASGAFSESESMTEVTVPAAIRRVSQGAFSGCSRLTKVTILNGDATLEGGAFEGCSQLAEIVIGPGERDRAICLPPLEDIGYGRPVGWMAETSTGDVWSEMITDPQTGCTCCRVRLPKEGATFRAVYDASGASFEERGTALALTGWPTESGLPTDFKVPSDIDGRPVVEICSGSFGGGGGVRRLTIAEGVEIIREAAFGSFSELEEIVLPASLWCLSDAAFCDCPNLMRIVISDGDLAGQTIRLPEVYRDNETFVGWNTKSDGTGDWCGSGVSVRVPEGGVTLNAVYAPFAAEWRKASDGVVITQCSGYPSSDVVFDSFGGYPVVGILPDGGLEDCGITRVRFGSSVKTMSPLAIRDWMSLTNIEFEAGALSGQKVSLPRDLNPYWDEQTQTDYVFAWWEGVDGKGEKFYVPWTYDVDACEYGYVLSVPESGVELIAVFLPNWIQFEINDNGLTLNGYGVGGSDVARFEVPAEIRGRPVTRIGASLFSGCSQLAEVAIPECVRSIAEGAFNDTPMVNSAANELVCVDGWLVARRYDNEGSLVRLSIPEGTVGIADYVLRDLPVRRIDLPETLRHVGAGAFADTQLTALSVPTSVVSFAATALAECRSLQTVAFEGTNLVGRTIGLPTVDSTVDGMRFVGWSSAADGSGVWPYYGNLGDAYDSYEFYCAVLPSEPTTWQAQLVDDSLQWEEYYDDARGIYGVRLTSFASTDEVVEIPSRIAGHPVVAIAGGAVCAEWAEEVILPSSSVTVEETAFGNCPCLSRITFRQGDEDVELRMPTVNDPYGRRFVGWCTSEDGNGDWSQYDESYAGNMVTVPAEGATYYAKWSADDGTWDWIEDGNGICLISFGGCVSDTLIIPDDIAGRAVVSIDDAVWDCIDKDSITALVLPDSLKQLGDVGEWTRLKKVTMPYGISGVNVGSYYSPTFSSCPNLDEFVITTGLSEDDDPWFIGKSVRKLTFSEGVRVINCPYTSSFYSDFTLSTLQTVSVPKTVERILSAKQFSCAFETGAAGEQYLGDWLVGCTGTYSGSKLVVREGTVGIADRALAENAYYSEITLPASLKFVGGYAFANCSELFSVIFNCNAPTAYYGIFAATPSDLLVSVNRDSTGWNGEDEGLPAKWPEYDGRPIAYLGTGGAAEVLLSLSVYPENAGTVQGAGLYAAGSSVRISTTAADGYEFLGWAGSATNAEAGIVDMGVCAVKTLSVRESLNVVAVYRPTERYVSSTESLAFSPTNSTGASTLAVPGRWLVERGLATEGVTSTKMATAALNADGQNGIPVWQSYVLGLDPTEARPAEEQLKVSIDGFDSEGKPIITFTPNRSDDAAVNSFVKYTKLGRENLSSGEWLDVDAVENSGRDFKFFRIQATVIAP